MQIERYSLPARDGYRLAVSSYRPAAPRYRLLLNSATGIGQRFYQHFASHAAQQGVWVYTYDYRGIAGSLDRDWQGAPPRMADWGTLDLASLLDHLPDDLPLALLGHSVGGQIPGLADNAKRIQALLGIAAQSGYWRLWPAAKQLRLALNWYALVPVATRVFGQLPSWLLGGEALPREVALEWARWCRTPAYLSTADGQPLRPHFADVRVPARFITISDDQAVAPERAVRELASFYTAASVELQSIAPQDWGLRKLEHFGFFRRDTPTLLWDQQLQWLERALGVLPVRAAA
jgi:predicted alpha/beta hydrolase